MELPRQMAELVQWRVPPVSHYQYRVFRVELSLLSMDYTLKTRKPMRSGKIGERYSPFASTYYNPSSDFSYYGKNKLHAKMYRRARYTLCKPIDTVFLFLCIDYHVSKHTILFLYPAWPKIAIVANLIHMR